MNETSPTQDATKQDVRIFWGAVYDAAYTEVDRDLNSASLLERLGELEAMFRLRRHMATEEMPVDELGGKSVLEIGPGAGGHSALYAAKGAHMTSIDITFSRAQATQTKFDLLGDRARGCAALQGDAENLPFPDGCFDIVYSNGVLHHTPDTERAIDEVYRVLKPGGRAVIMLYCKTSFDYWFNRWFCEGLLLGRMFRSRNWLGNATEWPGARKSQTVINPITRCYTRGGIGRLFHQFEDLRLRKSEFYFYLIPKLGRIYRRWQIKHYGVHPGGLLVYGEPWPIVSGVEVFLGRVMGWAWNIVAHKPERGDAP